MIELLEAVQAQRGIPLEVLYESIEEALTTAARIETGTESAVVAIDRTTGTPTIFERLCVVAEVTDRTTEIANVAGYEPGDFYDRPLDAKGFGRVAAVTARQVVSKRVIEFERERAFSKYRLLEGTLVDALVQRVERGNVYVLLDADNEACLPREHYRGPAPAINDRVRVVIESVRKTARGPAVWLSRASDRFIAALLPTWDLRAIAQSETGVLVAGRNPPNDYLDQLRTLGSAIGKNVRFCFWDEPFALIGYAMTALGGPDDWGWRSLVRIEPDNIAIVPAEAAALDLMLVERIANYRIIASDDITAVRAELQIERFAHHVETASTHVEKPDVAVDPAILAELLKFRAEREGQ